MFVVGHDRVASYLRANHEPFPCVNFVVEAAPELSFDNTLFDAYGSLFGMHIVLEPFVAFCEAFLVCSGKSFHDGRV